MKEKGICVMVGKCVGSTYRKVIEKTNSFMLFLGKASQSAGEEIREMFAKSDNLFRRVKNDGQLAHWEMKQKDNFAKFGEEVYRLKEAEINKLFKEGNVKQILEQIKKDQVQIDEIKDAMYAQQKRMSEIIIFKRALVELKSPEAHTRRVALRVMERINKKEAIPHLVNVLSDPDPEVRDRARELIQKLTIAAGHAAPSGGQIVPATE